MARHARGLTQRGQSTSSSMGVPNFDGLRFFKERGWLGFGMVGWGNYFSAPLYAEMDKRFGILKDEFSVLASLYEGIPLAAQTIAALTGRPKNSISRGVARLLARGHIKRVTNPNDRREAFLSLTPAGHKLHEQILPLCRSREIEMFNALSSAELATLDKLLMKLLTYYHQGPEGLGIEALKEAGVPRTIDSVRLPHGRPSQAT